MCVAQLATSSPGVYLALSTSTCFLSMRVGMILSVDGKCSDKFRPMSCGGDISRICGKKNGFLWRVDDFIHLFALPLRL